MSNPLISVVIPSYNYAHLLPRAVESVVSQLDNDIELLVVNDGSTDDTDGVVHQLLSLYSESFRYIKSENKGVAATRNRGIDETSGEFLVFLDADDELSDGGLLILREAISRSPGVKVIVGGHTAIHENGKEVFHGVCDIPTDPVERLRSYLLDKTVGLSNGAVAMHRDIFKGCRYNSEFRSAEDIPVFAYALGNFPVAVENRSVVRVHKHGDSLRHNVEYAKNAGVQLVDEVFRPDRIPSSAMRLKNAFVVQRYLSLSRTCFSSGDFEGCKLFFCNAVKVDWKALFKLSYARKALRSWLNARRVKP